MYEVLSVFPRELENKKTKEKFTVYNLTLEKDGKEIPYVSTTKECKLGDMIDGNLVETGRNDSKNQVYYKLVKKEPITREMVYTTVFILNQGKMTDEQIEKETDNWFDMLSKI
jgi:hypothetical protein